MEFLYGLLSGRYSTIAHQSRTDKHGRQMLFYCKYLTRRCQPSEIGQWVWYEKIEKNGHFRVMTVTGAAPNQTGTPPYQAYCNESKDKPQLFPDSLHCRSNRIAHTCLTTVWR